MYFALLRLGLYRTVPNRFAITSSRCGVGVVHAWSCVVEVWYGATSASTVRFPSLVGPGFGFGPRLVATVVHGGVWWRTVGGYHIFYHFNYVIIRRVMASYAYHGFRVSAGARSWNRWYFNEKGRSLLTGLVFGGGAKGHPLRHLENLGIPTFSRSPHIPRPRPRPHLERTDTLTNARSRKPQGLVDSKSYDRRRTPEQAQGTVLNRAPRLLHDNASSHLP